MMYALFDGDVLPPPAPTAEQKVRTEVLRRYWSADTKGMIETWEAAKYDPLFPDEVALLALACSHRGDDRAKSLIEQLRGFNPVEAQAIEALLLCQQARYGAAADQLECALVSLRKEPWCLSHVLELIFPTAIHIVANKPDELERMFRALGQPLAVYLFEEERLATAHAIAGLIGPQAMLETLAVYEPHVPWNERFLRSRYRVYEATGHPLTGRAHTEWKSLRNH